jgi:hypothetical protein
MTIITESLISECQSQKSICLNNILHKSYQRSYEYVNNLGIEFNINNLDIKKIIKHNVIIDICEFKKHLTRDSCLYIIKDEFNKEYNDIVEEIVLKMELYKIEKSKNFYKSLRKYLNLNGLLYISNVYLKQVSNKLALFR